MFDIAWRKRVANELLSCLHDMQPLAWLFGLEECLIVRLGNF